LSGSYKNIITNFSNVILLSIGGSLVAKSCATLETPWTEAHHALGFSRQEYWSRLPISFSKGSSQPRDQTCISSVSCITTAPLGKPKSVAVVQEILALNDP
jgi:hypothetical protein